MKLKNRTFVVVQTPDQEDHIVKTETEAINLLQNGDVDIDGAGGDDVSVLKIAYDNDDWAVESLGWQRILFEMLSE
jgi:hypothetical protein